MFFRNLTLFRFPTTTKLDDLDRNDPYYVRDVMQRLEFPLNPAHMKFTRPVFPYPLQARYSGRGDPNDAANFRPVKPAAR